MAMLRLLSSLLLRLLLADQATRSEMGRGGQKQREVGQKGGKGRRRWEMKGRKGDWLRSVGVGVQWTSSSRGSTRPPAAPAGLAAWSNSLLKAANGFSRGLHRNIGFRLAAQPGSHRAHAPRQAACALVIKIR